MRGQGDYLGSELDSNGCVVVEFELLFDKIQQNAALSNA